MLLRVEDKGFQPDLDFTIEGSELSRRTREYLRQREASQRKGIGYEKICQELQAVELDSWKEPLIISYADEATPKLRQFEGLLESPLAIAETPE